MSWEMVKLADVCDFQGGTQPPKSEWSNEYKNGYVKMLQIRNFTQSEKKFDEYVKDKSTLKKCVEDDILIGRYGASVGKILTGLSGAYNVALVKSIPSEQLEKKYFYFYLTTDYFQNFIQNIGSRAAQAGFNKSDLKSLQIPLPPLSTQKRIAEILDKADALRKKDQQLLKYYDDLAQSLFIDLFGDPVKNEKGWEVKKLGELGNWKSGGTPTRSNPEFFKGNIPWLSSGELNNMFIAESIESITEEAIQNSSTSLIPVNSLLLGMYDTAALKSSINKVVLSCNQAIAFSQLDKKISNVIFVYYLIRIGKEEFKKAQRGVRQKNLNLSLIKDIRTIHPPIDLQNQFATQIQNIEQQKERLKIQIQASEHLFQALLKQAFNGGLSV